MSAANLLWLLISTSCYKFIAILKNTDNDYRGASYTAPYMFILTIGTSDLAPL